MAGVTTLPPLLQPLMDGAPVRLDRCAVCGRARPLNEHHVVRRGAGRLYRDGAEVEKPTITLCGVGNHLTDASGARFCHGMAHHGLLHFRWIGEWEYLITVRPVKYQEALEMGGWRKLEIKK